MEPGDRPLFGERHPPTRRLMGRMGIGDYDRPVEWTKAPPAERLRLALLQGTGHPAKPVVKKGGAVQAGQKIAEAVNAVSVPLHAPVEGTVVEVTENHIEIEVR